MAMAKGLSELVLGIPCEISGNPKLEIKGIAYHSACVQPGFLFVAIDGFKASGRNFIDEAINRGAIAVATTDIRDVKKNWVTAIQTRFPRRFLAQVANRFYEFPSRKLSLIGVTGTNGKTTVCFMLRAVCRQLGFEPGFIGTIEHWDGERRRPASQTTPESLDFVAMLNRMVGKGVPVCISEVSSHSLELDRVFDLDFKVAVFTNLTPEHLDFHKTMESYKKAKMRLFEMLSPNAFAVTNFDDPVGREIAHCTKGRVVSYGSFAGLEFSLDITGEVVQVRPDGLDCIVRFDGKTLPVRLKLTGRHNLANLLATFGVAKALAWSWEAVKSGVEGLEKIPGRLEPVPNAQGFSVFIDYAHTPDALRRVLETVREFTAGRVMVVFGCGGDRDKTKRPLMGKLAVQLADVVVVTSDNPRSENPEAIIADILQGIREGEGRNQESCGKGQIIIEADRREAIRRALLQARGFDTVVIAGKGHENYQIIGDEIRQFDDREIVQEILRGI